MQGLSFSDLRIELQTAGYEPQGYDYEPGPGLTLVLTLQPRRSLDCEVGDGRVCRFNPKYCLES